MYLKHNSSYGASFQIKWCFIELVIEFHFQAERLFFPTPRDYSFVQVFAGTQSFYFHAKCKPTSPPPHNPQTTREVPTALCKWEGSASTKTSEPYSWGPPPKHPFPRSPFTCYRETSLTRFIPDGAYSDKGLKKLVYAIPHFFIVQSLWVQNYFVMGFLWGMQIKYFYKSVV